MLQSINKNYFTFSEAAELLSVSPENDSENENRNCELCSIQHPENNLRVYLKSQVDDFIAKL